MAAIGSVLFFVFSGIFSLLFTGGVIYLIVQLSKNKEKRVSFNMNTLLHLYFYIMSFVSLAISVIGLVIFVNALSSYKLGVPFSYQVREVNVPTDIEDKDMIDMSACYEGSVIEIEGQKVCFDTEKQKSDVVNGLSFFISMIILFAIHQVAIHYIEKKEKFVWLEKIYNFVSLIGYSIVGIISIPTAIHMLINYIYFRPEDITRISPPSIPVAIVLVTIPIWIVFLVKTLRSKEKALD